MVTITCKPFLKMVKSWKVPLTAWVNSLKDLISMMLTLRRSSPAWGSHHTHSVKPSEFTSRTRSPRSTKRLKNPVKLEKFKNLPQWLIHLHRKRKRAKVRVLKKMKNLKPNNKNPHPKFLLLNLKRLKLAHLNLRYHKSRRNQERFPKTAPKITGSNSVKDTQRSGGNFITSEKPSTVKTWSSRCWTWNLSKRLQDTLAWLILSHPAWRRSLTVDINHAFDSNLYIIYPW